MEVTYIGYVITREGIKYDSKKVKGIIDLGPSTTTREARALICMVHDYRYIWTRRSHVVAALKEVASNPKVRKYCGITL